MSTAYHIIEPSGGVHSGIWTGQLDDACIPHSRICELLSIREVEHLTCIWQGRPAHMFVDEFGYMHDAAVNPKATRIYMNATLRRNGHLAFLYENLADSPLFKITDLQDSLKARILVRSAHIILGRALLWEGGYE